MLSPVKEWGVMAYHDDIQRCLGIDKSDFYSANNILNHEMENIQLLLSYHNLKQHRTSLTEKRHITPYTKKDKDFNITLASKAHNF